MFLDNLCIKCWHVTIDILSKNIIRQNYLAHARKGFKINPPIYYVTYNLQKILEKIIQHRT